MFDHISIGARDFPRALAFYDAIMGALGHARCVGLEAEGWVGWGAPTCFLEVLRLDDGCRPAPAPGAHICFRAADAGQVQAFHAAALAAGGSCNGPPGPRPVYTPDYYAAFVRDPEGHRLEAVAYVQPSSPNAP
jgi:catechol 2,3-dioxygenase-like lactoylglutathione lyase family enzyme